MTLWVDRVPHDVAKHYAISFVYFSLIFFLCFLFFSFTCCCRLLAKFALVSFFLPFCRRNTQIYFYRLLKFCCCCSVFFFGSAPKAYSSIQKGKEFFLRFLDVCVFWLMGKRLDELSLLLSVHCVQPVNVNGSICVFVYTQTPIYGCIQTHTNTHTNTRTYALPRAHSDNRIRILRCVSLRVLVVRNTVANDFYSFRNIF